MIRVGVVSDHPEAFGCFMNLPTNSCVRPGYEIEIFDSIARKVLKWDYEFVLTDEYGYHGNDGQWTGLLGMLAHNVVDITAVTLRATQERIPFMEFSTFVGYFQQVFILKQPQELNIVRVVSEPFYSYAWLCLLAVFFVSSFIFAYGYHVLEGRNQYSSQCRAVLNKFAAALWDTYGLIMKQHECRSTSKNRNLLARLLLFAVGILLGTSYASMLACKLSVPLTRKIPFHDSEELANLMLQKSYTLISTKSGRQPSCLQCELFEKALRVNPILVEPNVTKFNQLIDTGKYVKWTTEDVLAASSDVSIFMDKTSRDQKTNNKIMIKDRLAWPTGVAFAFPRKSRYRRKFDEKLRTYLSYALTLKSRYGNIYYEFDPKNRPRRVQITIFHYYEILLLYATGVCISFVMFIFEKLSRAFL